MDSPNPSDRSPEVKPSPPAGDADLNQEPATFKAWLAQNGSMLVLLIALFVGIVLRWGWVPVIVGLGLGFLILIHELGHFLVAKWCDVHVETFSIGFGPALPGCRFQKGETTYMIAVVPLGGYVKMVGEGAEEEDDDDPRSFKNKTVWQRMAIISAGVFMNMVVGCICFIVVYMTHGVERPPGIVGFVDSGSAAWQAGMRPGEVIYRLGSKEHPFFDDIRPAVILSNPGQEIPISFGLPDRPPVTTALVPRPNEKAIPQIGVGQPKSLQLVPDKRYGKQPVGTGTPAAHAEPPFEFGDRIIGASVDPRDPSKVVQLPNDPRSPNHPQPDYFVFQHRMQDCAGKDFYVKVRRAGDKPDAPPVEKDIRVPPAFHYSLGLRMYMGKVVAVRQDSEARKAGIQWVQDKEKVEGDTIKAVEVEEAGGSRTRWVQYRSAAPVEGVIEKDLDPVRLPFELVQWATRTPGPKKVKLTVLRSGERKDKDEVNVEVAWDDNWTHDDPLLLSRSSPLAISGLGLAYQVQTIVEGVDPDSPAAKAHTDDGSMVGLEKDDEIQDVCFYEPGKDGGEPTPIEKTRWFFFTEKDWSELKGGNQWAYIFSDLQRQEAKRLLLRVKRGNKVLEMVIDAQEDRSWPMVERGLHLLTDVQIQRTDKLGEAVALGFQRTWNFVVMTYQQLQMMVTGRLSTKLLGGPLTIFQAAYVQADYGFFAFLLLLGVISINLAVVNFLPIPVLDGGHMVFLIYEWLRGKPASEQVKIVATYFGLGLILLLMVFVLVLDMQRLFG